MHTFILCMLVATVGLQILSWKVSQGVQAQEEPTQGSMDKGTSQSGWQGTGYRSKFRVRKATQRANQIQPRYLAEGY